MRPALALACVALAACTPLPATQVVVVLGADAELRERASVVHVTVWSQEGEVVLDHERELSAADAQLARVPVIPRDRDASRHFTVRAELLDAARDELARLEATLRFRENALTEARLTFEQACAGVACGEGRTCVDGTCVGACFESLALDEVGRARPRCGSCERCVAADCEPVADGEGCGCEGDVCASGRCVVARPVPSVVAGSAHTCAVVGNAGRDALDIYCWGSNESGQLGIETPDAPPRSPSPVVSYTPTTTWLAQLAGGGSTTCAVIGGSFHRVCWGSNNFGQLGDGTTDGAPVPRSVDEPAVGVLSGKSHFCGRTSAGEIWCWGYNARGQLGRGVESPRGTTPERVGDRSDWRSIEAEGLHSCGIRNDGTLWCWGYNDSGELGVGDRLNRTTPARVGCEPTQSDVCFEDWTTVSTGEYHTCGIRREGTLWCWGGHGNGQLGIGGGTSQATEPRAVIADTAWDAVVAGFRNTCAIRSDGALFCWGAGTEGQNGDGARERRSVPVEVAAPPAGERWERVDVGEQHACATRSDGSLYCWGANAEGQLGLGFVSETGVPVPRRVCFPL